MNLTQSFSLLSISFNKFPKSYYVSGFTIRFSKSLSYSLFNIPPSIFSLTILISRMLLLFMSNSKSFE